MDTKTKSGHTAHDVFGQIQLGEHAIDDDKWIFHCLVLVDGGRKYVSNMPYEGGTLKGKGFVLHSCAPLDVKPQASSCTIQNQPGEVHARQGAAAGHKKCRAKQNPGIVVRGKGRRKVRFGWGMLVLQVPLLRQCIPTLRGFFDRENKEPSCHRTGSP
eukprot:1157352-Pelagomonas_calceolata.AAC.6